MIRKILCWIGWHKYKLKTVVVPNGWGEFGGKLNEYSLQVKICKHCGKVKKR